MKERITLPVKETVFLRQAAVEDSEDIFRLIDSCRPYLNQYGENIADKYMTLESVRERNSQVNPGEKRFGIWDRDTLVGFIKLTEQNAATTEIGYWIGQQFTGKGYATNSVRILTDYALSELGYREVVAKVNSQNWTSMRVLQRVGYTNMGIDPDKPMSFIFRYTKI